MSTLGRNIVFPIKNRDGTPFYNLVLRKSSVETTVMSLGDKISGDVYYKDNSLVVTMNEYVEYNGVKYILISPPTVVREGVVSADSSLKGMAKYSFEFYHPMCILNNLPFSDVAVTSSEDLYLSQNKTFNWIGKPQDFIDKLNKNLEATEWVVVKNTRFPEGKEDQLSEVLSFDNNTIGDALKTWYDTWEIPFVIVQIDSSSAYYALGKRFAIEVGLPDTEIIVNGDPFVFVFGQGVGLKNNSRTPKNNKIVTRISGYGSENNIPYGYPQIVWYGDPNWEWTKYDYDVHVVPAEDAYPLYLGIVNGERVKLIKHPFTRTHLMPSIYRQTVFNKVSPYLPSGESNPNYDKDAEIKDYYDAIATEQYPYVNEINPESPSYEIKEFEKIKPELGEEHIVNAVPLNNDLTQAEKWIDDIDGDGNYLQSYFKITLPTLEFDLYACAAITEEMQINMRSGACIGCTFTVQVDWEDYKVNFYDSDGNFAPNGEQRDLEKYPKSNESQIDLILQKENSTFGIIMPNVYQNPKPSDAFVILGISLPESYVENAESRLDEEMKVYMLENNIHYFDYPLKFDEYFLATHTDILSQIHPNSVIRFDYNNTQLELFVKQITIKYNENVLPQYDITLTDNIEVTLNQIGQIQSDVDNLGALVSSLRQSYGRNIWDEINSKLSKRQPDTAHGKITFQQGWNGGAFTPDLTGAGLWKDEYNNWHIESDYLHARKKLVAKEVQIEDVHHVGGQQLLTAASMHADYVVNMDGVWRCFFLKEDDNQRQVTNNWKVGDQAYVNTFNLERQEDGTIGNHRLWRLVTATSNETPDTNTYTVDGETFDASNYHYIDLSKDICDELSDAPKQGDDIVQLGHQGNDRDRQNAIIIAGAGESSPYIREITGIVTFHLPDAETQLKPNDNKLTGKVQMVSGSTFPDGSNVEQFINDTNSNIDGLQNTIETLDTGNENLLLNTGFTGDFTDESVRSDDDVADDTQMYSRQLKHWEYQNVEVVPTANSASGYGVRLSSGSLSQVLTKPMTNGTWYCISFKASGSSVAVSLGGYQKVVTLSDNVKRYIVKMACEDANVNTFTFSGATGLFMEVQVTEGRIPNTDWLPSPQDNDKSLAYYQNLSYLMSAITNASTTILGGLILSQMLRVGNYRDGVMTEETGGMSGLYMNDNSPFLWGGGDMDKAFYTINKYAQNPAYQPTDDEVAQMAKFVVTHGGRAILNDIILRGYIYALGGVFNGTVYANSGRFKNIVSPNGNFKIDDAGNFECTNAKISGNLFMPLFEIDSGNANLYLHLNQDTGLFDVYLDKTGLNIQFKGEIWGGTSIGITPPYTEMWNGAQMYIRNSSTSEIVVHGASGAGNLYTLQGGDLGVFFCYHATGDNYYWKQING